METAQTKMEDVVSNYNGNAEFKKYLSSPEGQKQMKEASTEVKKTDDSLAPPAAGPNVGAIVGGVIGACAAVGLLIGGIVYYRKRRS